MALLAQIPLFRSLTEIGPVGASERDAGPGATGHPALVRLARCCREISLARGEVVCRFGEEADAFYVVVSGELEVWSAGQEPKVISRLGPGEFFGEMALLTGSRRSATVTVARHAELLVLDRAEFDSFVTGDARIIHNLATHMAKRLARTSRGEVAPRRTTLVAVLGPSRLKGKTLTSYVLAGLLGKITGRPALHVSLRLPAPGAPRAPEVLDLARDPLDAVASRLVRRSGCPARLVVHLDPGAGRDANRRLLFEGLKRLEPVAAYVVVDAGPEVGKLLPNLPREVDFAVRVVSRPSKSPARRRAPGGGTRVFDLVNCWNRPCDRPVNHMEPFILPKEPALEALELVDQWGYVRDHPEAAIARPLYRLARKILGVTVGVAFGGGAAFGVAHMGIVKVLEEKGIPIDVVAGTSMGSAIALSYAAGLSGAGMEEIARKTGWWGTVSQTLDLTLLEPGFFTGEHLLAGLRPLFNGRKTFDQLLVPCRTVATDVESGERVTLARGDIETACRASCSVPMVWTPVVIDGRTLVDGGIADPVPAEVVREMGADVCIAVNVVPLPRKGVENILSRGVRQARNVLILEGLLGTKDLPNLFDVVMNSIQILQYELGYYRAICADVQISPDLADFTWIEFYRAAELVERGEQAARAKVGEIRRLLDERLQRDAGAWVGAEPEVPALVEAAGVS